MRFKNIFQDTRFYDKYYIIFKLSIQLENYFSLIIVEIYFKSHD